MKNVIKQAAGVVAGISVGAFVTLLIRKVQEDHERSKEIEKTNVEMMLKARESEKKQELFKELISKQTHVEELTAEELVSWFKTEKEKDWDQIADDIKMIIAPPTPSVLGELGYPDDGNVTESSNVLQVFYDTEESEVLKGRLINYTGTETNLWDRLFEKNGFIVSLL